ncbi:hypothetical protein V5799_024485 [Amblyomma americanum]|uniref:Uncharacterized protein n=1 Tax=Amblyomma americanum TaxID=6943 RepID=A0AAQ4EBX3_AMBAM
MVGNVTDQKGELAATAHSKFRAYGDIVVPRKGRTCEILQLGRNNTSSYLQFAPWILENCPQVDLVVFVQANVLPYPFYLPNYRVMHMNHRPEVIHCHGLGDFPTSLCHAGSVVIAKKPGLELFSRKASVQGGKLILYKLEAKDLGSYLAVDDSRTMLYTVGVVVFYTFPRSVNVTMMSLWEEMMSAPENSPDYLRL